MMVIPTIEDLIMRMMRDAARYRWLRTSDFDIFGSPHAIDLAGEELDKAIDGALSAGLDGTLTTENNMGNTWEIQVWKPIEWRGGEYGYEEFWRGQSWLAAAWNFLKAKREGHGCVTLHWR